MNDSDMHNKINFRLDIIESNLFINILISLLVHKQSRLLHDLPCKIEIYWQKNI